MTTLTPDRPPAVTTGDRVRFVLRGLGQTLITLGLVVLLFVVYELWVTNIFAARAQHEVHVEYQQVLQGKADDPLVGQLALPGSGAASTIPVGTGIANLYLPRLGKDYAFTIVEGTTDSALEKGPGHYAGTALPGQIGNFAVAGHRVGKGEPFLNIDQLRPGDAVVVETKASWFIYQVLGDPATSNLSTPSTEGVVGREIVDPSDSAVVAPVPNRPGVTPTAALMTMTTCHPKFDASHRMIVHAQLARTVPRAGDALPRELIFDVNYLGGEMCSGVHLALAPAAGTVGSAAAPGGAPGGGGMRGPAVRGVPLGRAAPAVQPRDGGPVSHPVRVLVVDNYDSFVYNLVQYLAQLGAEVEVRRNDAVTVDDAAVTRADGVLISPGPGTPQDAGVSIPLVRACADRAQPLLGVCLGHQAIGAAFGGVVSRAPELLHGKTSDIEHHGAGVLMGLPSPFVATRYHSLAVERGGLSDVLEVTGWTASGVVMALRHRTLPLEGVQFHPESVLTQGGHRLLANWLRQCGGRVDDDRVTALGVDVDALRTTAFATV